MRPIRCTGLLIAMAALATSAAARSGEPPDLRAAAATFRLLPGAQDGLATSSKTGTGVQRVVEPLETAVVLLESASRRIVLITTHLNSVLRPNASREMRRIAAAAAGLPERLVPVTVHHAIATEDRITYNRKGRRADGSTYFMPEEDRLLVGTDFRGDIDTQAPLVVLEDEAGRAVAALVQFTGHPVTSYHPERPVVHGDWPQTACRVVGEALARRDAGRGGPAAREPVPVGFLQGCAGDINSKGMLSDNGVARAEEFGRMLGERLAAVIPELVPSARGGCDVAVTRVGVPLGPLPPRVEIVAELAEIDDFMRRAAAGDADTLFCAGLNFPRALSPAYRGKLVEAIRPWYVWALEQHATARAADLPRALEVEVVSIRLGDVGIIGLPCEPLVGIGRLARKECKLPLVIPCGYTNVSPTTRRSASARSWRRGFGSAGGITRRAGRPGSAATASSGPARSSTATLRSATFSSRATTP